MLLVSCFWFVACQEQRDTVAKQSEKNQKENELHRDFLVWKAQQDPKKIEAYQQFLAQHLKHPPSLFDLSYNIHIRDPNCAQYRFALAPESEWKNIVKPLKVLESLQANGVVAHYRITSSYRIKLANACSHGASRSKHLGNYALDFQVLNEQGNPYLDDDTQMQKKLCEFWRLHGGSLKLGLGTYTKNRFHIDVQGYRTWGHTYKRDSSACLTM